MFFGDIVRCTYDVAKKTYDVVYDIVYDVVCNIAYDVVYDIVYDIVGISSSCMKGCKSAGPCFWNLVLLSTCVSIFLQLFSELSSLTCDSYCALKTRATPTLSHTPSDSADLCRDSLVHRPPLLPPASPFKQNLFEERPILATPTPGFRGYVQP